MTRATDVDLPLVGTLRVARTEELIAMKVLSMREDQDLLAKLAALAAVVGEATRATR